MNRFMRVSQELLDLIKELSVNRETQADTVIRALKCLKGISHKNKIGDVYGRKKVSDL
jgi:hypothetical protein